MSWDPTIEEDAEKGLLPQRGEQGRLPVQTGGGNKVDQQEPSPPPDLRPEKKPAMGASHARSSTLGSPFVPQTGYGLSTRVTHTRTPDFL